MQEYQLLAFDDQTVRLFDPAFPIINKELPREEFDRLLAENPLNDGLLQVVKEAPTAESAGPDTPGYHLGFGHMATASRSGIVWSWRTATIKSSPISPLTEPLNSMWTICRGM